MIKLIFYNINCLIFVEVLKDQIYKKNNQTIFILIFVYNTCLNSNLINASIMDINNSIKNSYADIQIIMSFLFEKVYHVKTEIYILKCLIFKF